MEALIEILIEIFGEIFLEGLVYFIGWILSKIVYDEKRKRIVKYGISFSIFACSIALLIYALITKKTLYVQIVLTYFLVLFLIYIVNFINRNMLNQSKLELICRWIQRIIHYSFPIVLIVVACLYPSNATTAIITFSVIGILIYFCILIYRIFYKKPYRRAERKLKRLLKAYLNKNHVESYKEAKRFMESNLSVVKEFIKTCTKEELGLVIEMAADFSAIVAYDFYEELLQAAKKYYENAEDLLLPIYEQMQERDIYNL